jgi:hypothetical protein
MKKKLIAFTMVMLVLVSYLFSGSNIKINAAVKDDKPIMLEKPSFAYYISDKASTKKTKSIKLNVKSSKANNISEDDQWLKDNKLTLNTYEIPNYYSNTTGNLPEELDTEWNNLIITSAFYDSSYIYCTYGADYSEGYILNIYNAKTMELKYSLDFSAYRYSPQYIKADYDFILQRINWATIKGGVLYISHSHNTYAKSSKNMNGYITAIKLSDNSVLWRTKALVSNANNFLMVGNVIVTGYGFTDEADYLYQIDRNTGKVLNKQLLKSAASYIIKKGNFLYVHTYNTDYKFEIVQ